MLVTGFKDLDAMTFVDCPTCGLPAGKCCMGVKRGEGRLSKQHAERIARYFEEFPDRIELYTEAGRVATAARARAYNAKLMKIGKDKLEGNYRVNEE